MKLFKVMVVAVTLTMLASLFGGCGTGNKSANEPTKEKKVRIGLSLPTQAQERWVRDKEKIEAECKRLNVDLKVQIANEDSSKQDAQCENLLAQGIDVLIVAPQDAKSAATIIEKAHKANVKVISYDRLIMNSDIDLYISFDNVKVGEIQGQYLTKLVPKGNYIVLAGAPSDNNAKLFKQGAMKYIQPLADKGDIKIVADQAIADWLPVNALKIVENALTANNNNIQGILAPADSSAGGVIEALALQKLDGKIPVTGQDAELTAAQRIVKGTQIMTVFKDTRELGAKAVELAIKMANGEKIATTSTVNNGKIDAPSILLTPIAVDKTNLDEILIKSGYLKKEDVYNK